MADRPDFSWEWYGANEPYYGVITLPGFKTRNINAQRLESFFASGRQHVEWLLEGIQMLGGSPSPRRVLDFGCGVGRILVALAEACREVVGADLSSSMLDEARKNCSTRGLSNVELIKCSGSIEELHGTFDLIHSSAVFQHVPLSDGYELVRRLITRLAGGGVAALQFPFANLASPSVRAVRFLRQRSQALNALLHRLRWNHSLPIMQMNVYSLNRLFLIAREADCEMIVKPVGKLAHYPGGMVFFTHNRWRPYPAPQW